MLERRYRQRGGEIDLIALDDEVVVFVEVKTRTGTGYGQPAESITAAKRRRLGRLALGYLARSGWGERPCRFDVVEVLFDRLEGAGETRVRHLVDAFRLWPTG